MEPESEVEIVYNSVGEKISSLKEVHRKRPRRITGSPYLQLIRKLFAFWH